jgi:nucleotide-binding universal stress UspA family protein
MANEAAGPLILAGWDGREQTRGALALAAVLARPLGARVTVVHVAPRVSGVADLIRECAETSERVIDQAPMELLAGIESQTRVVAGDSPAEGLQRAAAESGASILVLGRSHRGRLGSVAENLFHGAPCAVAIAPPAYADKAPASLQVIAAAYDASAESRAALRQAADLAKAVGAAVHVISVPLSPEYVWAGSDRPYSVHLFGEIPGERTQHELDTAVELLAREVSATGEVRLGPPAKAISEACETGVDLLVMGSRGYGAVRRVLLGSVSGKVIHSAPCPVLVVPQPAKERDPEPAAAAAVG